MLSMAARCFLAAAVAGYAEDTAVNPSGGAPPAAVASRASAKPVDPELREAGLRLYDKLRAVSASEAFVFGHHNTDILGEKWTDYSASGIRSDVITATGGHLPGMVGYNLNWVAMGQNADWSKHVSHMKAKGLIFHIYWEANNPTTCTVKDGETKGCQDAKDLSGNPIEEILPGGRANDVWVLWMDRVADFFHMCGQQGVGTIFRPFHENTGEWFWWGIETATPEQYRKAWDYTQDYLWHTRGVHNILFAYAPSKPSGNWYESYGPRYPGDDRVDITCFDRYGPGDFHEELMQDCSKVVDFAHAHQKIPAICEAGVAGGSQNSHLANWYKTALLDPIVASDRCAEIAFVYTWANRAVNNYWVPLRGQALYSGFMEFFKSAHTIFEGDERLAGLYGDASNASEPEADVINYV